MSDLFEKKMANKYRSHKDLVDRLQGTYVRYDGRPYYVWDITKTPKLKLVPNPEIPTAEFEANTISISPADPLLDISAIDLGYTTRVGHHGKKEAIYFMRTASRHYKQGTCLEHIRANRLDGKAVSGGHKELLSLLNEEYSSLRQVYADSSWLSIALSKRVALERLEVGVVVIYVCSTQVGWMDPRDYSFRTSLSVGKDVWLFRRELEKVGIIVDEDA